MPRERFDKHKEASTATGVYVDLQTLIKLQFEIRGFSLLPKQPVQSLLTGKHRSRLRGRGLDFEEVRAYEHGDDIRNIDWKVTARVRKPHTKIYTEERERPVFIIVDQSASMFFGSSQKMKSVTATHAAALAAWKVLAVGDRVGGIVFNDLELSETKPNRDRRAVQRFLQLMVEKNAALSVESYRHQNPDMLNSVLQKTAKVVTHDYLLMVISDFAGFNDQTMKTLISLSRHNDVILFMVTDPMEAMLPEGELVLSDSNSQISLNATDQSNRQKYREASLKKLEDIRDKTKSYNISFIEISTDSPVSDQIRKMLNSGKSRK